MFRIDIVACILVFCLRLGFGGGNFPARGWCLGSGSSAAGELDLASRSLWDSPAKIWWMESGGAATAGIPLRKISRPIAAVLERRPCARRLSLRGGRSKRSGKRVRKALEESGGKSAAAARFPTGTWESKVGLFRLAPSVSVSLRPCLSLPLSLPPSISLLLSQNQCPE